MSQQATLEINGETREYAAGGMPSTISELVSSLGVDPGMVVAEVNGEIVKRTDFSVHRLADGDKVELVRFVGGG